MSQLTQHTDDSSRSSNSQTPTDQVIPPKVEVTIERLDGIFWSTSRRSKSRKDRDELKKHVPFVTATVEFVGTCPDMKVYSASRCQYSRQPVVESYFASLKEGSIDKRDAGNSEVRKITKTTTEEWGGKTTTTTTTTITTVQTFSHPEERRGFNLVAKWHDDTKEKQLVDSVTFFTKPEAYDSKKEDVPPLLEDGRSKNPHFTMSLPSPYDSQEKASLMESLISTCTRSSHRSRGESYYCKSVSCKPDHGIHTKKLITAANTHSTANSTECSISSNSESSTAQFQGARGANGLIEKLQQHQVSPVMQMGSLLDQDDEDDDNESFGDIGNGTGAASVAPVLATKKSKELAATAIAAEPSSAVVGKVSDETDVLGSPPWMACWSVTPEIVELRVRVIPEDSDALETDPMAIRSEAPQNLEAVAHLVFYDQTTIEDGTTVMDLPLKLANDGKSAPSSAVCGKECVTMGTDAKLRVRVSILRPQGGVTSKQIIPQSSSNPSVSHEVLKENSSLETDESFQHNSTPFYAPILALRAQFNALSHIQFFQCQSWNFSGGASDNMDESIEHPVESHKKQFRRRTSGSFPHEFPAVVPEPAQQRIEPFLGDYNQATHKESSWSLFKLLPGLSGRHQSFASASQSKRSDRSQGVVPFENSKHFYTLPTATGSCPSDDVSSIDASESLVGSYIFSHI